MPLQLSKLNTFILPKFIKSQVKFMLGLPRWLNGKESTCQCRRHKRHRYDSWVRKISCHRKWQPTPVFFPGKSHGQRSLVGYSPWICKELDLTERPRTHHTHTHTHTHTVCIGQSQSSNLSLSPGLSSSNHQFVSPSVTLFMFLSSYLNIFRQEMQYSCLKNRALNFFIY